MAEQFLDGNQHICLIATQKLHNMYLNIFLVLHFKI